jgi:phosphoenolpyruvate phosphomutase
MITSLPLLQRLLSPAQQKGVGIFDGLSARLASRYDFDFLWLSSFSLSASKGRPDMGLVSATELCGAIRDVQNNSQIPLVVDIDSGYGDIAYLHNFSRDLVRMGVDGICIEDNLLSKRSSLYEIEERKIATAEEHAVRLQVIREVIQKHNSSCMLIARTEALVAGMGTDEALRRARLYKGIGADAIFVQSCDETGEEVKEFLSLWGRKAPVFVTPTKYVSVPLNTLYAGGATHIIFANQVIRSAFLSMNNTLARLEEISCLSEMESSICAVHEIARAVGADELQHLEQKLTLIYQ